jgi:hypothetical protein
MFFLLLDASREAKDEFCFKSLLVTSVAWCLRVLV